MRFRLMMAVVLGAALIVLFGFSVSLVGTAQAQGGCPATYTVQYGDTLFSIARRFNTTVFELMALNRGRIWNPNFIFARSTICVPVPPTRSQVAVEATYQYTPNEGEIGWTLTSRGGFVGKRVVYPLRPVEPVDTVEDPLQITAEITRSGAAGLPPLLVGMRNSADESTYTLVTVGGEAVLSSWRISGTVPVRSECLAARRVKDALGDERTNQVEVTLWLEAEGGLRYPFSVTRVDSLPDVSLFETCYTGPGKDENMAFALFPARIGRADEHRILMRLSQDGFGPPGRGWRARCSSWHGGWYYRWLRAWYGC
ncbi:MAG: LysM peptidoglycan-binding domain-containing protein [Anaerolineae bacterium]